MLKKLGTLKVRFSIITFLTYLTLITVVLSACYFRFFQTMLSSYERLGDEVLRFAAEDIVIDHIPQYLSGDYDPLEYERTLGELDKYPQYFREVYYLYAYQVNDDAKSATVIFDAAVDHDERQPLGDYYELEWDVLEQIDKLQNGLPMDTLTDNTKWGYLLTRSTPLIDSNGVCQGYLLVDFNLTEAKHANERFILQLFLLVFAIMCVIFYGGMKAVTIRITKPIEKIYRCLSTFRYSNNRDREDNIRRLKALNIHTNAEIQSLYEALVSTTEDSYLYLHEYQAATKKLGVANEKAYSDSLTGFYNKNAYEDRVKLYQQQLDAGESLSIAIIMLDINNLKYVNDTFGHKRGDEYIKGCCFAIADLCRYSSIYRIGGDEFVIILEKDDYVNRQAVYEKMAARFRASYQNTEKQPWERYSASIGMTDVFPGDTSIADVFKRADSAMYQAKAEFKATYGSYR